MAKPVQPVKLKGKKFYRGAKVIGPKHRDYKTIVLRWVAGQLAQGKSLEGILPIESTETLPDIMELMKWVNHSEEHKNIYNEARMARYTLLSERLVSAVQRYEQSPSKENAAVLQAINEARKYLEKGGVDQNAITVEVTSMVPNNFWTKSDFKIKGQHEKQ